MDFWQSGQEGLLLEALRAQGCHMQQGTTDASKRGEVRRPTIPLKR